MITARGGYPEAFWMCGGLEVGGRRASPTRRPTRGALGGHSPEPVSFSFPDLVAVDAATSTVRSPRPGAANTPGLDVPATSHDPNL